MKIGSLPDLTIKIRSWIAYWREQYTFFLVEGKRCPKASTALRHDCRIGPSFGAWLSRFWNSVILPDLIAVLKFERTQPSSAAKVRASGTANNYTFVDQRRHAEIVVILWTGDLFAPDQFAGGAV